MAEATYYPAGTDITDVFEIEPGDGEKTTQQRRLDDIISDLTDSTDESELRVYRQVNGGRSSMRLLETFPVDKYSMTELWNYLRITYGSGDYRIHVRQNGKLLANKLIEIETPKIPATNGPSQMGEMGQILNAFLERQERQNQQMLDMLNQQQPQQSRMDFLREFAMMKQIFFDGGSGQQNSSISQMQETISFLKELGFGPQEKEEDDSFGNLLAKMSPLVAAAVAQGNNQPQQQPQTPQPQKSPMPNPQQMMIKLGVQNLLRAASKDSDPAPYAQMILDQMPEEAIREYIASPTALASLQKIDQRVVRYTDWFTQLGEHVKYLLGMESAVAGEYGDELYGEEDSGITAKTADHGPTPDAISPDLPSQ